MGLAYFFLFIIILGAAGAAVALLVLAWIIWKKSRFKIFSVIPVLLAVPCAVAAFYLLAIVWREPPWGVISDGLTNILINAWGKCPKAGGKNNYS